MRLNELLKPGEGPVYQLGNKIAQDPDGKIVISGNDPGARSQYFATSAGQIYVINFDPAKNPPSMSLSFGNLETSGNYTSVNYSDLRKLPVKQAAQVLNTVVSATTAYSEANGGVPLWIFNTNSQKKARVYKMISARIAKQIQGGFRYFKDSWQDYLFAVYVGHRGQADLKKWIDFVTEYGDVEENPSDI